MCGLYTKKTTIAWLESQLSVLDCWIEDVSTNPDGNMSLLECIQGHRKWLDNELKVLKNPGRYRLSGFSKQAIYSLVPNKTLLAQ